MAETPKWIGSQDWTKMDEFTKRRYIKHLDDSIAESQKKRIEREIWAQENPNYRENFKAFERRGAIKEVPPYIEPVKAPNVSLKNISTGVMATILPYLAEKALKIEGLNKNEDEILKKYERKKLAEALAKRKKNKE